MAKNLPLPVTDDQKQALAQLQERFSSIQIIDNPAEKLLALDALSKDSTQFSSKITQETRLFCLQNNQKSTKKDFLLGTGLAVSSTVAATLILGPPGAAIFGFFGIMSSGMLAARWADTTQVSDAELQESTKASPLVSSLTQLTSNVTSLRTALFETPDSIYAIVDSKKFPEIFEIANQDEKKILTFAFRSAAEKRNEETPAPMIKKYSNGSDIRL